MLVIYRVRFVISLWAMPIKMALVKDKLILDVSNKELKESVFFVI